MNDELRQALSAIEGVERSEVQLTDDGPLAIRVRLARDANRRAVAEAVQRLLEAHGLRSRVAPDRRQPGPGAPPAPPPEAPRPASGPGPAPGPPHVAEETPGWAPPSNGVESVTVSETEASVLVTVVADGGRTAIHRARRTEQGLHEAIVAAVGELIDPETPPAGLRAIEFSESYAAMTVYVERADGVVRIGAALVAASHPFALAQAVWAALQP